MYAWVRKHLDTCDKYPHARYRKVDKKKLM